MKAASRNLTKRYEPSIHQPSGCQSIASAGFISTRPATILAPFSSGRAVKADGDR